MTKKVDKKVVKEARKEWGFTNMRKDLLWQE